MRSGTTISTCPVHCIATATTRRRFGWSCGALTTRRSACRSRRSVLLATSVRFGCFLR
jgi:hypothetical protein